MPPRKTPIISASYEHLRFWVCKLCAPTPDPEQPTEHLAEGSAAGVQVGDCGHPVDHRHLVGDRVMCLCGQSWPQGKRPPTLGRGSVLPRPSARHEDHEPGSFTDCLQCEAIAGRRAAEIGRALALNPNPGHSGPYPASLFLERAVAHDGRLRVDGLGGRWLLDCIQGEVVSGARELTLLSNFTPFGRLFALAALEYGDAPKLAGGVHVSAGCSQVILDSGRGDLRDDLNALVCYQHGDGFDVGVENVRERHYTADAGLPPKPRGLRLEPGTALIVYGGAAVGVAGWVRGSPVLLMAPEGACLIQQDELVLEGYPLIKAINARWSERIRS